MLQMRRAKQVGDVPEGLFRQQREGFGLNGQDVLAAKFFHTDIIAGKLAVLRRVLRKREHLGEIEVGHWGNSPA